MIEIARGSRFQMMGRFLLDGQAKDVTQWQSVKVTLTDFQTNVIFATLNTQIIDPANGVVKVWANDTSAWPIGRARIDAQIVDGYGNPYNSMPDFFRVVASMLNTKSALPAPTSEPAP